MPLKRKLPDQIPCKYGESCYQKNPEHHKKYSHPNKLSKKEPASNKDYEISDSSSSSSDHENITDQKENERVDNAGTEEYKVKVISSKNTKDKIKEMFLVEMPEDFFLFWDFCCTLSKPHPENAFNDLLGLQLVGPFDVLSGKLATNSLSEADLLCHWRYYYDPPEFQTVLTRDDELLFHIGYFRDTPGEMPSFVASNCETEGCVLSPIGANLFAAINSEINQKMKSNLEKKYKEKLLQLQKKLTQFAKSKKLLLDQKPPKVKQREKKIVAKTFHAAGLVVPVKNDVGYRPLPKSDSQLKALFTKIVESTTDEEKDKYLDELQEIITLVQFANDECDYGMGLELGIDLFCFGHSVFHNFILTLLPLAYELLGKNEYAQIILAHLKNRRKGENLKFK